MCILLSLIFMIGGMFGDNHMFFLAAGLFAIADSIDGLTKHFKTFLNNIGVTDSNEENL